MASSCHLAVLVKSRLTVRRLLSARNYLLLNTEKFVREFRSASVFTSSVWGTKKTARKVKLKLNSPVMADPKTEEILAPLRLSVKEQGETVRKLKAANAPEFNIKQAVAELKIRKKKLEDVEMSLLPATFFDRNKMEDLLKRRFYYDISFSIYGGVSGQFDFGPMGCALKNNIISLWRNFFVLEEQMLEMDCSIITPEPVFKTSGHVDRFADLMIKDVGNGECFRLDHLIKSSLEKIMNEKNTSPEVKEECKDICIKLDGMTKDEMSEIIEKFNIKSPLTNNELSKPMEFNLMFGTEIGPAGLVKGFLRPETAQGIFVNFERLLGFNQGRLPFAAAQVGQAFRNEISPRSGLIRVREFTLAEIEHFCHPDDKSHSKFPSVANTVLTLYSACNQMDGKGAEQISIGDAVKSGLVANETLGYFMARIYLFLIKIGIDPTKVRFRQHMANEMAHYACDCWDAECLTSYGWIECVGCADRSAYDLTQHSKATRKRLVAEKPLSEPKVVDVREVVLNNAIAGKQFKSSLKVIRETLADFDDEKIELFEKKLKEEGVYILEIGDKKFEITKEMATVERYNKILHVEEYTPSVIEPSFGIGRIMYSLFEHSFKIRQDDDKRTFFSFPPCVAPIKCSLLPLLSRNESLDHFAKILTADLKEQEISQKLDDGTGSIGRRYVRMDEISIPFAITIDFDTLKEPHTVTLRERDSTSQVRIPVGEVANVVNDLCKSRLTWEQVQEKYPKFEQ